MPNSEKTIKKTLPICDDGKIYNPASKRCVLISGKIGQRVLAESKKSLICDKDNKKCALISVKNVLVDSEKTIKTTIPICDKGKKNCAKKYNFPLIGQTKATPEENDPLRKFYTSLLKQKPNSEMAIKWCTEHGLMPNQKKDNV